ncbi:Variant-specific surface protein [Giardia duodenalis assemblage B]|uniref:Variant-specific surface protein n=1 Tax=Giardia duodenalis assemblage B TaxID=1394984 RepID=A0A132NWA4_GIAIN|nr:Variant-specific surface protein [Giardia intestinalis assemblage B]
MWLPLILSLAFQDSTPVACKDEILVYTHEDFALIQSCPNSRFLLMNNVTVVGPMPVIPIFKGTFDGQGFYVGGIVLSELYDKAALFETFSGSMRNVTIATTLSVTNSEAKFISGFTIELTDAYFYDVWIVSNILVKNCTAGTVIGGAISSTSETAPGLTINSHITVMDCECVVGGAIGQLDNNYTALLPSYWSSSITVNSIIKLYNSSSTVGGYVGVSEKNIHSLTLIASIEVLGNKKYNCLVGGAVGKITGAIIHSDIVLTKMYVSGCTNDENSIVGGLGTSLVCSFPNCTIAEDLHLHVGLFYTNEIPKARIGGGFGLLDSVSISYIYLRFIHLEVESPFGGLATTINCTNIDQAAVSIDYITWIGSADDPFLIGGFGGLVDNYTTIRNSVFNLREVDLNYTSTASSYFGGFAANASKLFISNSYAAVSLAILNSSETVGANSSFGVMLGRVTCIADEQVRIISSFVAADSILAHGRGSELFNIGGFAGHLLESTADSQCFELANSWSSIKFHINEIRKASTSPFAVGSIIGNPGEASFVITDIYVKTHFDIVNIQKYKYDNINNDGKYNAVGILTGFYSENKNVLINRRMQISRVLCQVDVIFEENFSAQIYYAPSAPACLLCNDIFITNTSKHFSGFSSTAATLADPVEMQQRDFYTHFTFGADQIWQYNLDLYPYHTSLPFLHDHLSDDNEAIFITPICDHHLCWNYSHVWSAQRSMVSLNLQYTDNQCYIQHCILCYSISPSICMRCASGYVLNASGDTCLKCHSSCMKCSIPDLPNQCTSCAIYGDVLFNGLCTSSLYACNVPYCLLCSFTNAKSCSVCTPGKGVQEENGYCTACKAGCSTCTLSQTCSSCSDYTVETLEGYCDYNSAGCYNTCKFCKKDNYEICLKCINLSYILDEYGNCQKRSVPFCMVYNCATCSSADNYICNVCKNGYYLTTDRLCKACEQHCSTCSSYSVCLECMDPSIRPIGGICNYSNNCTITGCSTCTIGVESTCLICSTGYVLTDNMCKQLVDNHLKQIRIVQWTAAVLALMAVTIHVAYPLVRYRKYLRDESISLQLESF